MYALHSSICVTCSRGIWPSYDWHSLHSYFHLITMWGTQQWAVIRHSFTLTPQRTPQILFQTRRDFLRIGQRIWSINILPRKAQSPPYSRIFIKCKNKSPFPALLWIYPVCYLLSSILSLMLWFLVNKYVSKSRWLLTPCQNLYVITARCM